jgi:hypothetical protein
LGLCDEPLLMGHYLLRDDLHHHHAYHACHLPFQDMTWPTRHRT